MPQISLTNEEIAKVSRLADELSKSEYLRQRMSEKPQEVLREFGLDEISAAAFTAVRMVLPNAIGLAAQARVINGHTDWVPHWDHSDSHSDSWGRFIREAERRQD